MSDIKKVVLAYSGGLDTSVIVRWLQDTYQCEVVTFTADIGQGEEVEPARAKAEALGVAPRANLAPVFPERSTTTADWVSDWMRITALPLCTLTSAFC